MTTALLPSKIELIDEINDSLAAMSPKEAHRILSKLTVADLMILSWAVEDALKDEDEKELS